VRTILVVPVQSGKRIARAVIIAAGSTVAAPLVVDLVLFAVYAASYKGVCGPHPTDIPARPCGYGDYLGDFLGDAFAVAGLLMIDVAVFVAAALLASVFTLLWVTSARRDGLLNPRG
jgi:hypothetical protein